MSKVAVIVQKSSRTGDDVLDRLENEFGQEVLFMAASEDSDSFCAAARRAKAEGAEILAVAGGDGTVGRAADCCIDLDLALGIIPAGTGNALAHELGISIDSVAALRELKSAIERRIDVGSCDGRRFVTVATLGMSSSIAKLLDRDGKSRFGRLAYIPAVIKAVVRAKSIPMVIEADGERIERDVMQFVASSCRLHGGPFPTTENASIDDGLLSVCVVSTKGRWALLRYGLGLLVGKQWALPDVWSIEAKKVTVRLEAARDFIVDGDPVFAREMTFESEHKALRVMVPSGQ